jgi:hypothetical protein
MAMAQSMAEFMHGERLRRHGRGSGNAWQAPRRNLEKRRMWVSMEGRHGC